MKTANQVDRHAFPLRESKWFRWLASSLASLGLKPNQISMLSIDFAIVGSVFFVATDNSSGMLQSGCFVGAALAVLLRTLCNKLDGTMAIEGGMTSKLGVFFNELPSRIADNLLLIFAGYAAGSGEIGVTLGWACALLALLTAHIRALGAAQGLKQDFGGPMARPHRMFVLAIACLLAAVEAVVKLHPIAMTIGLSIIAIGSLVTCMLRIWRLAKTLESRTH
jgi:phosphatidylglycerophosphate synthase